MALHIIQISCGPDSFSEIIGIGSAKVAWDRLAKWFLHVLEKHNYVDWSVRVRTYLMAHHLWEIIEATSHPPKQEDDEAVFKAWSKKNSMALHVIQISCGPDSLSEIIGISSAEVAWDTLEKKFNSGVDYVQYEALKKAMESGDWNTAEEFLKRQPDAAAAKITDYGETALDLAVEAGHEDIVEKLVDLMSEEDLAIQDIFGNTALVQIINSGNYRMAACMVRKNNNLLRIKDSNQDIPVSKALFHGETELARYFYSLTPLEHLTPESGFHGATLCYRAIYNRSLYKNELLRILLWI
ncbi:uncharacterized protein LOC132167670 isoform X2 [Corylus avellana]|uniref:uncharacterized protein LOC132167670 isoform X2 n=1 Tax=Corylus avellana TaxID=13451 RepID=UPI00286B496C|nr:uncharacterized protein LOC132167670 isoform X2 [Corylus avellana]